jgi:hypothetical protein
MEPVRLARRTERRHFNTLEIKPALSLTDTKRHKPDETDQRQSGERALPVWKDPRALQLAPSPTGPIPDFGLWTIPLVRHKPNETGRQLQNRNHPWLLVIEFSLGLGHLTLDISTGHLG